MKAALSIAKEFLWFFAALLIVEILFQLFRSQSPEISSPALTKAAAAALLIAIGRWLFHGKTR